MKRESDRSPEEATDEELLDASADGDRRAFDQLFRRHYAHVFRVAHGALLDGAEANDVAQEVFVRLYQRPNQWSRVVPLRHFLFQVALNEALGVRRRLRAFGRQWYLQRAQRTPEDAVQRSQTVILLERELLALQPRQRAALALYLEADLEPREIALVMRMTPNATRVLLHRALEQVRQRAQSAGLVLPDDSPQLALEEA